MNPKRFDLLLGQQTLQATRVFEATLSDTASTSREIYKRLQQAQIPMKDLRVVEGCLASLVNTGLLKEARRGYFIRVRVNSDDTTAETATASGIILPKLPPRGHATAMHDALVNASPIYKEPAEIVIPMPPLGDRCNMVIKQLKSLSELAPDKVALAYLELAEVLEGTCQPNPSFHYVAELQDDYRQTPKPGRNRRQVDVDIPGLSEAPEYRIWIGLTTPSGKKVMEEQNITLDPRWEESFKMFLEEVGYRPCFGAKLVRKDITEGWYKENVVWRQGRTTLPFQSSPPNVWPFMKSHDESMRKAKRKS